MPWYEHRRTGEQALRTIIPPARISANKVLDHLDANCLRLIAHSTFVLIATRDSDGSPDVSRKGDTVGFIRVIDDRTLAIPDRPGRSVSISDQFFGDQSK